MYKFIATILPKDLREKYKRLLNYAGVSTDVNLFLGFVIFFGFGSSLGLSLIFGRMVSWPLWLLFIVLFFSMEILVYYVLLLRADKKGNFVETLLPDALQLMASNLKAGLTIDKALLLSARPEFGPLQDEIGRVGKEVTMGKTVQEALMGMTERIKSDKLNKTMLLVVSGVNSGGELASLLQETAINLRRQFFVEERIKSNVMMYVMFITTAVAFGSPILFGLSSFLVEVLTKNIQSANLGGMPSSASSMPMAFSSVSVSTDFIMMFAIVSLLTTCFLGSLVLGLISKGKERDGLKYVPFLSMASLGMFFLIRLAIKSMLGDLFGL